MNRYVPVFLAAFFTLSLAAGTVESRTVPASDGVLIDSTGDGIVDKVIAVKEQGEDREILTGNIWKQNRKAVFEFPVPEFTGTVKKATLKLYLNGNYGCHPDKEGSNGPATDLFYYLAPEADGKVELTDDNGEKLGLAIEAKPVVKTSGKPLPPVEIDVTAAVAAAAAAKSAWIGFRLEAASDAPQGTAWRFRTSEFAALSGKQYCPSLIIVTE